MFRKAAGLVLAEHQPVAGFDVENAAFTPDQLGINSELVFDRGRQTGSPRQVVSLRAVLDAHFHEKVSHG